MSWEWALGKAARLEAGYVGSRSHKLFSTWYLNRAHAVPGIAQTTATIPQRRVDQRYADIRLVINGSRAYYDAAKVSLIIPNWHGLTLNASYWFSKALDLGSNYANNSSDADSKSKFGGSISC